MRKGHVSIDMYIRNITKGLQSFNINFLVASYSNTDLSSPGKFTKSDKSIHRVLPVCLELASLQIINYAF